MRKMFFTNKSENSENVWFHCVKKMGTFGVGNEEIPLPRRRLLCVKHKSCGH